MFQWQMYLQTCHGPNVSSRLGKPTVGPAPKPSPSAGVGGKAAVAAGRLTASKPFALEVPMVMEDDEVGDGVIN